MKLKHYYLLLLPFLALIVTAQNNDELHIPLESDNQFPPENHSDPDGSVIEGSGDGIVEESIDKTTELTLVPKIEDIQHTATTEEISSNSFDIACPKPCVCNTEGDSSNFVVDCSGYELTEFPPLIDPRTTTLNLQNNKLTEIPKEISALKNLKILNANNNQIMEISPGSVSELPKLVSLKLANNRLIEYPKDLKSSIILTKLEELDLGGNDMRTTLTSDIFTQFKSLKKLTLATSTPQLLDDLCATFKDSLETVCIGSCETQSIDCPDTPQNIEEDLIDATLPGMIAFNIGADADDNDNAVDDNIDPIIDSPSNDKTEKPQEQTKLTKPVETSPTLQKKDESISEFSLRTAVNKEPAQDVKLNSFVDTPKEETKTSTEPDVKIGAKTVDTNTGGVDKSVIGIIVAGMIVVVAVITIKKNWSSIRRRFTSSPRPPNDRTEIANGTTPEEVPLQDKSPV